MSKALIITSYIEHFDDLKQLDFQYDFVICTDNGLTYCSELNLKPNLFVGDADSIDRETLNSVTCEKIILPSEKDASDCEIALEYALQYGYNNITILGGLGGRFDHTLGAISLLINHPCSFHLTTKIQDGKHEVYVLMPGNYTFHRKDYDYFSVFSSSPITENITLSGVKYPLSNYNLTNDTTLGLSNKIVSEQANLSFDQGKLIVVYSNE